MCFWQRTLILSTRSSYWPLGVHLKSSLFNLCFPLLRCRVLQVGVSRAHSTGLSLTSVWGHTGHFQMFLKPFPASTITTYSLLLLEFLTAQSPSLPLPCLAFFRAFLPDYSLIHTKRNRHKKKKKKKTMIWSIYGRYKEVLTLWKLGKNVLSSQMMRTAWNTGMCSVHHWTKSCSTEEQRFTDNRNKTRETTILTEKKNSVLCHLTNGNVLSRAKEKACSE